MRKGVALMIASGILLLVSVFFASSSQVHADGGTPVPAKDLQIGIETYATGFTAPLYVTNAGDGSKRLFVVEKRGTIEILHDGKKNDQPFLDISSLIDSISTERGLLGLAFHPKYKDNGQFYVDYTDVNGNTVIAQYKVSSNADTADPQSAKILLHIDQPFPNHNGGQLAFGPDGYLYIGMGDGGSAGDPFKNGQNTNALLGKILRIDVDSGDPYGIPKDNPFADGKNGRPEVWAIGMRNPWRFSFDRATGDLYIADVGQNTYEEVDVQPAKTPGGVNYGWNVMEGKHCFPDSANCDQTGLTTPVAEYTHDSGCSITGGYVYRGSVFPRLQGTYFFSDFCSGRIWALQHTGDDWQTVQALDKSGAISSFGEDESGEVYLTDLNSGNIYHLVDKTS